MALRVVGNLTAEQLIHFTNVSELISVFSAEHAFISVVLSGFTGLALLTSFLGVAMALFTQNQDMFKQNKVVTYVISFILPLTGAIYAADQFLSVLSYAGIILVFLAVFVPLAMVVKLRKSENAEKTYIAEGGVAMLIFSFAFGGFLLISQVI